MLDTFRVDTLVVSFIPDDLTRCEFDRRYTPLPWFDLDGDGLVLRGVPIDHSTPEHDGERGWKDVLGHSALLDVILASTCREWWYENEKQRCVPHLVGRGPEIGQRLVGRLADTCRVRGVRLLLLLQGERPTDGAVAVLRRAEELDVRTLDLASRYVELSAADASLARRWFAGHMTRAGNAWVAREVAHLLSGWR
jgi:hypothetical protein